MTTALVVGAGIAGPALAHRLASRGVAVTVVERATGQRSSGAPVDVRGPAIPVVEAMGVVPQLRDVATRAVRAVFVDTRGRPIGQVPQQFGDGTALEVPRSDLSAILVAAASERAEFVLDESVTALHDDGHGVDVEFERGRPRRFDLVVGTDGLHSRVRSLAFGDESRFVRPLGITVAGVTLAEPPADPESVVLHSTPGHTVALHPSAGRAMAAFFWRGGPPSERERHEPDAQKRLVAGAFAGMGWRTSELLGAVTASDDVYLDAVSLVRMPTWSRGRIGLLGDAATCASLLGDGSSTALAGAEVLAAAVAAQPDDLPAALRAYERAHRPLVEVRQRGVRMAAAFLVPATAAGLAARDLGLRIVGTATAVWLLRRWSGEPARARR
jgi:2-polyprenyl-6-methoxyphenol hydroxylase-like FAD-dependent oxidoreductase